MVSLPVILPVTPEKNFPSSPSTLAFAGLEVRGEMLPSEDTIVVPLNWELN